MACHRIDNRHLDNSFGSGFVFYKSQPAINSNNADCLGYCSSNVRLFDGQHTNSCSLDNERTVAWSGSGSVDSWTWRERRITISRW